MFEKYIEICITDYRRILHQRLERESEQVPISIAEVKNAWSFTYSLPSYAFMSC
jgi:hypothetical protein